MEVWKVVITELYERLESPVSSRCSGWSIKRKVHNSILEKWTFVQSGVECGNVGFLSGKHFVGEVEFALGRAVHKAVEAFSVSGTFGFLFVAEGGDIGEVGSKAVPEPSTSATGGILSYSAFEVVFESLDGVLGSCREFQHRGSEVVVVLSCEVLHLFVVDEKFCAELVDEFVVDFDLSHLVHPLDIFRGEEVKLGHNLFDTLNVSLFGEIHSDSGVLSMFHVEAVAFTHIGGESVCTDNADNGERDFETGRSVV